MKVLFHALPGGTGETADLLTRDLEYTSRGVPKTADRVTCGASSVVKARDDRIPYAREPFTKSAETIANALA